MDREGRSVIQSRKLSRHPPPPPAPPPLQSPARPVYQPYPKPFNVSGSKGILGRHGTAILDCTYPWTVSELAIFFTPWPSLDLGPKPFISLPLLRGLTDPRVGDP